MLCLATFVATLSVALAQNLPGNILPIDVTTQKPFTPPWYCHQNECPRFSILQQNSDFETRHYEPSVWIGAMASDIDLQSYQSRQLFYKLFHYIDHGNSEGRKIAMTTPVVTEYNSKADGKYDVSMYFMVPFALQANPPKPNDTSLFIERAPAMTFYVKSYPGYSTSLQSQQQMLDLKQHVDKAALTYDTTKFFTAGYDGPYTFSHRHNEVWLVASQDSSVVGKR